MKLIPNDCTHHMALTMPNGLDCLVKIMPTDDQYEVMVLVTSGDQAGIVDYRWRVDAGAAFNSTTRTASKFRTDPITTSIRRS